MAFNVQSFRSQLAYDGARPNQFRVEMNFPAVLGVAANVQEKFAFMCKGAEIPDIRQGVITEHYYGAPVKIPGDKDFDDWTVTIINDEDFLIRETIEKWSGLLRSHGTNVRDTSMMHSSGYSVDAQVTQFSKAGENFPIKKYKFVGLWPNRLGPIELRWDENNRIEEFAVTFSYIWWEDDKGYVGGIPNS